MRKRLWLLAGAAVLAASAALVGFEAGRRYPWAVLDAWFGDPPPLPPGWSKRAPVPMARYEASGAVIGGKIYVFGGFHQRDIRAMARVDVYDRATNTWTRKADMPSATTHRNPVPLGDTVWFAGGFVGDDPGPPTGEVWKYHVLTDRWLGGPALPAPRAGGALIHVNGTLHYIGGYGADRDTSRADHWTLELASQDDGWHAAEPLPRARGHHAGVPLDGAIYIVGGAVHHDPVQVDVDWVDRYDVASRRWSRAASLPEPVSHTEPSTFVYQGRIVVAGGRNNTGRDRVSDLIQEYDPAADTWLPIGRMPAGRLAPLALAAGDSLYLGAGADASNLATDTDLWVRPLANPWQRLGEMPVPLGEVAAMARDGHVLLIGQGAPQTLRYALSTDQWEAPFALAMRPWHGHHHASEWIDSAWHVIGGLGVTAGRYVQVFDAAANRWRLGPELPWSGGSVASAVIGGTLYVGGGITGDTTVAHAAKLDPVTGRWTPIAPMPLARNHAASATDGARWYVFGGRGPGSGAGNELANGFAETQIYDPVADRWTVSGSGAEAPLPLPQARGGMGRAVYARGEFWVFGGETIDGPGATAAGVYDRVDIYDPVRNRWRAGPPMPTARHGIFPVLVGDRIYVIAGGTHAGGSGSTVVEYLELRRVPPASTR